MDNLNTSQAADILSGHGFTADDVESLIDGAKTYGSRQVQSGPLGKRAVVQAAGGRLSVEVERTIAMHRDVVADFAHFRAGDRILWSDPFSGREETGTVLAWTVRMQLNHEGVPICLEAVAVIRRSWVMDERYRVITRTFSKYGSGIRAVYR